MQELPHLYTVSSTGTTEGKLITQAKGLSDIEVAPPEQFVGPGDQWSPEDLFMAAIANCFILSFRAIARASKLEWAAIDCVCEGTLDKVERQLKFTQVVSKVRLRILAEEDRERAEKLLQKAEHSCLISNSLSCESSLAFEISVD